MSAFQPSLLVALDLAEEEGFRVDRFDVLGHAPLIVASGRVEMSPRLFALLESRLEIVWTPDGTTWCVWPVVPPPETGVLADLGRIAASPRIRHVALWVALYRRGFVWSSDRIMLHATSVLDDLRDELDSHFSRVYGDTHEEYWMLPTNPE